MYRRIRNTIRCWLQTSLFIGGLTGHYLTVEQGLPNRYVFTVGQDKTGFVWIGTLDNAYRFHGQRFHALPTNANTPKNKRYVPMVNHILTDPVGNLWLTGFLNTEYDK